MGERPTKSNVWIHNISESIPINFSCLWLVTRNLCAYYTLYCMCMITSGHNRGASAEASKATEAALYTCAYITYTSTIVPFLCTLIPTQLPSYYWMVLLVSLRTYKTILTSQYGGIFYVAIFCHPCVFLSSAVSNKSVQLETHCHRDITELWIHTRSCSPKFVHRCNTPASNFSLLELSLLFCFGLRNC